MMTETMRTTEAIKMSGNSGRFPVFPFMNAFAVIVLTLFLLPLQPQPAQAAESVAAVSGLKTTGISSSKVSLTWSSSKKATSYRVYRKISGGKYKLVKTVKKTSARIEVKKGKKYRFKVVAVRKNKGKTEVSKGTAVAYNNKELVSLSHQKYSYHEMEEDIRGLAEKYHDYVSFRSVGKSEEGREIYDVVLGNPDANKAVLVVSAIHAREYVTTVILMKQLEYYLINYNKKIDGVKPADVFSECCIHYVMMANPDGVMISQGANPLWKGNANGINLNRNFPYNFVVEGSKKNNDYSGKKAASEKETMAIMKISQELSSAYELAVVNYHAMGNIVFGSYSGNDSRIKKMTSDMYSIARKTTGYADAASYNGSSHGNYRPYLTDVLKVPSITLEVGSSPCPLPQKTYESIYKKNRLVILREAQMLRKN